MTELSGLLPIFKPTGMTSKDVSRVLVRRFGKLKIGHVGTLDPDADGVLPVLVGSATKLQDYLLDMPKAYRFIVKLGTATDTLDASGKVTETKPFAHVTESAIRTAAAKFVGKIRQMPPLYSAVKLDGRELYKHARGGGEPITDEQMRRLVREVFVYHLDILRFSNDEIELFVRCSKGTYVRTIADDLTKELGTVGHVTFLRRELSAGFALTQCKPLDEVTSSDVALETMLIPMESISIGLPIWTSDDSLLIRRIRDGQRINMLAIEFEKHLIEKPDLLSDFKKGFLIRNSEGYGIGIGELTIHEDHVIIHLKRGL